MARVHSSGWELETNGVLMDGGAWESFGTIIPTRSAGAARSGGFGMLPDTTANTSGVRKTIDIDIIDFLYHFRFYLRIATDVSGLTTIFSTENSGFQALFSLRLNADRTLELWDDGLSAQVGSDSTALLANTWYRIEIENVGSGNQTANIYVATEDGPASLYLTGTYTNAAETADIFSLGKLSATTGTLHFDDFAVNDRLGSAHTGFCGPGHIVYLMPNAAGDNAMGTRGGTDSGSDWGQIDERAPNDITDYYILDVDNDIIDVNIESLSALIPKNSNVRLIQVGVRHRASTFATTTYNARIKSQASGTAESGAATTHNDTNWLTNGDVPPRLYGLTSYTDPQSGGRWTVPLVDTAQIGVIATAALLADSWITTIWALVEYMPTRVRDPIKAGGTVVPYQR